VRVPIGWLRDYIDLDGISTDDVAQRLAMAGFPVEGVERRPKLGGIVVGRIIKLERHPNADRLQVCTIDVGTGTPLTIATAATNVAEGQVIPVATIGADLVDADGKPLRIEPRKMRGIESQGMLCSAFELGLDGSWFEDGIMQLDADLPLGTDVVREFRLDDDVLDVEITANRVDVMSMAGIARELGASLRRTVREPLDRMPVPSLGATDGEGDGARVTIESADCRRFVAQRFSGVEVRPSPAWMRVRLALAGQRPIDNLVDVSNFVMLELGQPQHIYDFDRLAGGRLIVRDARAGETIRTLDGEERKLDPTMLVIADENAAQCLAGLMGAAASEVTAGTREILVESANFRGPRVRRMGIATGLRSEASSRHERSLPVELPDAGAWRAAALLSAQGAQARAPFAVGVEPAEREEIAVTAPAISALLGIPLDEAAVTDALTSLGFAVRADGDALYVRPPYWRNDVAIAADVAEEVARVVGYERIAAELPPVAEQDVSSAEYRRERDVAGAFAAGGYREAMTLSLQPLAVYDRFKAAGVAPPAPPVEIVNPLSEDQRFMRFSLLGGLLAVVAAHESAAPLRLFEVGHVFERGGSEREQFEIVETSWAYATQRADEPAWRDTGFLAFKGESEAIVRALTGRVPETVTAKTPGLHPGKTAELVVGGKGVARIGAVDPRLLAAYGISPAVFAGVLRNADLPPYEIPQYRAPSRFPAVERDLALVLAPDVPAVEVCSVIATAAAGLARRCAVFDEYRGPQIPGGRKSIAVRVTFQRDDATLTDPEVEERVAAILAALRERLGAEIRG